MSRSCLGASYPPLATAAGATADSPAEAAAEMAPAGQVLDDAAALGYGAALRSQFGLEEGYAQLNHGSFGVCPLTVNDNRKALLGAAPNPAGSPDHRPPAC